ncbi:hypothetical protein C5O25_12265 [Paramuribaculum intestinale]|uniref:Uncharacterized protein n=3 Tax=Muribaculaceae TaxID=2005473 RepID=A0A2V1INT0_9BACT|nr:MULTISPECIES: hypothetical protein [Muribaculaceae]MBJ2185387.1 hypothetical protein [Muribaculaceae bacterium]ROS88345.1 hypothetical protein EEL36_13910 [Muribaculaceae bacterium Isolate-043 (Harlan)]ROT04252.1 hypothetical protein EEL42_11420 [Muribaculaceae bacterium Isolate-100 (HZI)]RXE64276.1 hypothetical protein ED388_12050 [Muribaculaceae bacterium Isolate-007 (NCI)]PWB05762.1 hypothetical protein C5O24_11075 [Paramuribaculum intestinale]
MKQNTDERRRKIDEMRERFAPLRDYMAQHRKETLELMRRRHAYYTKLITDAEIKIAEEFYERYSEQFLMYGIELKLSDNKKWCSIHLELEDYGYEDYGVEDGKDDTLAEVSPEVSFKDMFNNVEVNIFTGEEL